MVQTDKNPVALIQTSDGRKIYIELYTDAAPITVKNFIGLVQEKYYDGLCFHRIIENFMAQGGGYYIEKSSLKEAPKRPTIKGEFSSNGVRNYLRHTAGVISMARTTVKDSASTQFFLCTAATAYLDGSYAAFGKTADEESLKQLMGLGSVNTDVIDAEFTDFPFPPIIIESIRIVGDE